MPIRSLQRFAKRALLTAWLLLLFPLCLSAMDRWTALSLIESGDNDGAIGPGGEVSRYQIKPSLWDSVAPTNSSPADPTNALAVARIIMRDRCATFERRSNRPPTDVEFYVLWNAPAQLLGTSPRAAVTPCVADRAQRFGNLVGSKP